MNHLSDRVFKMARVKRPLRTGDRVQHTLTHRLGTVVGYQRYGNIVARWFNKHLTVKMDGGLLVPGLDPREFVLISSRSRFLDTCGGIVAYRQSL